MKLAAAAESDDSDTALMFRRSPEGAACRQRAVTGTLTEGDKRELPKCFHELLDHLESPTNEATGAKVKPADYINMLNAKDDPREIDLVILRRKLSGIAKKVKRRATRATAPICTRLCLTRGRCGLFDWRT